MKEEEEEVSRFKSSKKGGFRGTSGFKGTSSIKPSILLFYMKLEGKKKKK